MRRVIDYKIVRILTDSQEAIKKLLAEGWELFGSPFQSGSHQSAAIQALVKFDKPTDEPRTVTDLQYATGSDLAELTAAVRRHLVEGWVPFGSLVIGSGDAESRVLYQGMMKHSND
jgi:hypothetical protein